MPDRPNVDRDTRQRSRSRTSVLKSAASLVTLLVAVATYSAWRTPQSAVHATSGHDVASGSAANGGALWQRFCAACHQAPAPGVAALGPVLLSREYLSYATDRHLDSSITRGVPGTMMTPWGGRTGPLDPDAVRDVIAYMRSKQTTAPSDPAWKPARTVAIP